MIKPINDYILLKEINVSEEQIENGIVLSLPKEDTDSRLKKFEVISITDGYINPNTDKATKVNDKIKIGATVIMDKFSGKKVIDNNVEYVMAKEVEIMGIIE